MTSQEKILASIIVCSYARFDSLKIALQSLLVQDNSLRINYEIIVVDNSLDAQLRPVIEAYKTPSALPVRYYHQPQKGKSFALNLGVASARGEILIFTDDDVIADPHWLMTLFRFFKDHPCDAVGGRVLPEYSKNTPQWIKDNPMQIAGGVVIYDYGEKNFLYDKSQYPFIGANFACRREVFDECGLFRTDLGPGTPLAGEDTEFVERLFKHGKKIYYCGQALVWHPVDPERLKLSHIARWHVALGRYCARMEMDQKIKISSYWFGIPRYLFMGVLKDGLGMPLSGFDRLKFFNAWRAMFRKIGMIKEYYLSARDKSKLEQRTLCQK